ncbi:hypothetical protein [Paraburkholderia sediminicola]|uniref:hypothetical protein n=1 Tax=Paraburkholderia sediminicola TaxID=458836 RepID=UPI0038BD0260
MTFLLESHSAYKWENTVRRISESLAFGVVCSVAFAGFLSLDERERQSDLGQVKAWMAVAFGAIAVASYNFFHFAIRPAVGNLVTVRSVKTRLKEGESAEQKQDESSGKDN